MLSQRIWQALAAATRFSPCVLRCAAASIGRDGSGVLPRVPSTGVRAAPVVVTSRDHGGGPSPAPGPRPPPVTSPAGGRQGSGSPSSAQPSPRQGSLGQPDSSAMVTQGSLPPGSLLRAPPVTSGAAGGPQPPRAASLSAPGGGNAPMQRQSSGRGAGGGSSSAPAARPRSVEPSPAAARADWSAGRVSGASNSAAAGAAGPAASAFAANAQQRLRSSPPESPRGGSGGPAGGGSAPAGSPARRVGSLSNWIGEPPHHGSAGGGMPHGALVTGSEAAASADKLKGGQSFGASLSPAAQ